MNELPPPKSGARQWIGSSALCICIGIVLLATLWPTPLDTDYGTSIEKVLSVLHRNGVPQWFGYRKLEFFANVLMFVPLGFLAALLLPARAWWLALILCPGLSVCIELTQAFALSARFATVSDIVANSFGALIGVLVAVVLRSIVYQRDAKLIARALWERGLSG